MTTKARSLVQRTVLAFAIALALALISGACVKAPDLVFADQQTAFEEQAAGEYRALENDLHQANVAPKGEDLTLEAMEAQKSESGESSLGEVAQLYSAVRTDADWIDDMLAAGCMGEGLDGLLQTPDTPCERAVDTGRLTRVMERANLHRRQLWQVMHKQQPQASEERIRASWRARHLQRVVCGALVQSADRSWTNKSC